MSVSARSVGGASCSAVPAGSLNRRASVGATSWSRFPALEERHVNRLEIRQSTRSSGAQCELYGTINRTDSEVSSEWSMTDQAAGEGARQKSDKNSKAIRSLTRYALYSSSPVA